MAGTDRKTHWENVYSTKGETGVSWYQSEPRLSLELIRSVAPARGGRIIDAGGGASVLVDRLLDVPFEKVAVLDISETALQKARSRLGRRANLVEWIAADITEVGEGFSLVTKARETHTTPRGASQAFFYGVFKRQ
jgi:hypothetical protein